MKRRDFLGAAAAGLTVATVPSPLQALLSRRAAPWLLVPMDDSQADHLKAYGVTFRTLERGQKAEWLLNYRSGAFLLPGDPATVRDCALSGVSVEPPNAAPWDDAVTMALNYAGVSFEKIWDQEVLQGGLGEYDWLHLHHEDFTGQYSKFVINYAGAPWLTEMIERNRNMARTLGMPSVPAMKRAVAQAISAYVDQGGFLFAMCTATETIDLALASEGVDIAASYADNSPMDSNASQRMQWARTFAFQDARLELSPTMAVFSDIDGHQVNSPERRQPLGSFSLFSFSAKIDPVPAMLVQNHRQVIPDFYGLTTSFNRRALKPAITILADEPGAPWAKYIHGQHGQGTWTFFGGHDPEDPQHQIGDAPTDLSMHPHSPGYRLILNNVLFPAAKKKELKT